MGHNITILLVDDEPNIQRTLAVILERAGYLVITATSGQETIQIIEKQRVDLVFLDNNMPGMSGLELLPHILRKLPNLPVIMLTAYPSEETCFKAMSLGARGYLVKPLDPMSILKFAKGYLNKTEQPATSLSED